MTRPIADIIRTEPIAAAALVVAAGGAATILGAYYFQFVLGLPPCPLCLEQRVPYYVGIPHAVVVAVLALRKGTPRGLLIGGLLLLAAAMLVGAGLGVFHSGIEWKLWAGPTDCSGGAGLGSAGGLLDRLQNINVVRCDEAAWRFLGLSLAGYNVLISLALAFAASWGVAAGRKQV